MTADAACEDESLDVAGAHVPRGCQPLAVVDFTPAPGTLGNVEVDQYASRRERDYQYGVELRYMRQYDGERTDAPVPGISVSRMIHTGSSGDLFAVVIKTRSDLVIEFVAAQREGALTRRQIRASIDAAHTVTNSLTSSA